MRKIFGYAILPLVVTLSLGATPIEDDSYYSRVRPVDDTEGNNALDALEGKAPPPIISESWANTEALDWDTLRGKVVILDFWGVWCAPCREALPKLHSLQEKHTDAGLVVLGVHTEQSRRQGKKFVSNGSVQYPVVFDLDDKTAAAFHVRSYPTYFIVDHRAFSASPMCTTTN